MPPVFRCPKCKLVQDVPFGGWHWEGKEPGKQHFVHRGYVMPDPKNPLRLVCPDGHDPKLLMPICWACEAPFEYIAG